MPKQKPHRSEQTVGTPWDFIDAVEERFGPLTIDLASDKKNAKAPMYITVEQDTFTVKWARNYEGNMWLNPEFGNIKPYVAKCATEVKRLRFPPWKKGKEQPEAPPYGPNSLRAPYDRILLLVPASVGSHWFWDYVAPNALVLPLQPRLKFIGHEAHYPKDLVLCVFGEKPGFERWVWKESTR